jgi:hypothetical protein
MSDSKSGLFDGLLTETMNKLAREVGTMDLDDPERSKRINQLSHLAEISTALKSQTNTLLLQRMDEFAREIQSLPRHDSRLAHIADEILRLSGNLKTIGEH